MRQENEKEERGEKEKEVKELSTSKLMTEVKLELKKNLLMVSLNIL